jgi:hypothetical protein
MFSRRAAAESSREVKIPTFGLEIKKNTGSALNSSGTKIA